MAKVDIGELPKILEAQPDLKATTAYATRAMVVNDSRLGDFASIIVFGTEEATPEIIMQKTELIRFAREILDKLDKN